MKLTLKTLKQIPYEIEIESEDSLISDLKKIVETNHGFDSKTLKLVFNGVILKDTETIKSYKILEGNVLVMMNAKAKPQNVQEKPVEKKEEPKIENNNNTTNNTNNNNITNTTTTTNNTTTQPIPKDYTEEIKNLEDMGFPKKESEAAIKAARGNVSLAIEFLYNGIPENLPPENVDVNNTNNTGNVGGDQPKTPLDAVKKIASIVKIMCAQDPSQLQNILLGLQESQPEILELIKQHETEFKNMINQPVTEEDMAAFRGMSGGSGLGGGSGTGTGGTDVNNPNVVKLSKTEYEAVQRLKEFGFSEMEAAQAYFACDKNEEYALNFLFENKNQDLGEFQQFPNEQINNNNTNLSNNNNTNTTEKKEEIKDNKPEEVKKEDEKKPENTDDKKEDKKDEEK